jgi:hypothetical protein
MLEGHEERELFRIVREIAEAEPTYDGMNGDLCCAYCYMDNDHAPDCPWRRLGEFLAKIGQPVNA